MRKEFPFLDLQIPIFPLWRNALPKLSLLISHLCLLFLFITLVTSNAFFFFYFTAHIAIDLISHFSFPWKSQVTAEANWKETRLYLSGLHCDKNLHHHALAANYSCALALLFPISASGCCTNQILSKISEFFFSSAAQGPGKRANPVLFHWHRSGLMPGN